MKQTATMAAIHQMTKIFWIFFWANGRFDKPGLYLAYGLDKDTEIYDLLYILPIPYRWLCGPELVEFPEVTDIFAKNQPQYRPLPCFRYPNDKEGKIVCCWQLSLRDRIIVMLRGKTWHQVLTFNGRLQPQLLMIDKPDMESCTGDKCVHDGSACCEIYKGYMCTLPAGHKGKHIACAGSARHSVFVWAMIIFCAIIAVGCQKPDTAQSQPAKTQSQAQESGPHPILADPNLERSKFDGLKISVQCGYLQGYLDGRQGKPYNDKDILFFCAKTQHKFYGIPDSEFEPKQ